MTTTFSSTGLIKIKQHENHKTVTVEVQVHRIASSSSSLEKEEKSKEEKYFCVILAENGLKRPCGLLSFTSFYKKFFLIRKKKTDKFSTFAKNTMLKHVQISPLRQRSDPVSLRSSTSCSSSICGSPEPPSEIQITPSRASRYSSLNEQLPQTTIKVFTSCLKIDIEYKTLGIQWDTTSKEVIGQLLRRLKMRHSDPRLFYLSMEVSVRRAGVKTILVLDDDTRPAILQACHPKGESRFCLQLRHTAEL